MFVDFTLKITDVRVDGKSYTGTVCGLNQGVLQNISVSESQKDIRDRKSVV